MTRLSLALLGPTQLTLDGQPVAGFAYHKARALLAYLVVEADRPHQRDTLAALLWPELPDEAARHNLRQALTNLRTAIGDASATPPFLLITRDTIQFNPASDHELDTSAFLALLRACNTHAHRRLERCRSCAARLEQALTLYRGDFLAGLSVGDSAPFEEWQLRLRERLHRQALDALIHLADYYARRGDDTRARHYAQRQLELEPWCEEAHRQLMHLLARGGQRSAALAQYEACRRILARDLGVEPEAETKALYEHIRDTASTGLPKPKRSAHSVQNFPAQTSLLIGREAELAELGSLLENPACRLITITGPGGIGKTRLALAAAAEQADVFADGAAFVPLQAISSAAFLAPAILAALDVSLQRQRDPRDQVLDYLRGRELLLVLDNLEQLLAADRNDSEGVAALLTDILQRAPGVTLLVTSRERLALRGEWLFELSGLNYPSGEPVNGFEGYSAVLLFVQRAGQVRRQFALVDSEARAVARICRLVEGLPLAIELAAAALRTRSVTAIAAAIESDLSALSTALRATPERQRSMWATFEHSWRLLSAEERQVFAQLSVFRGGFTQDAAAQVAQASPQLLAALLDKSLLRWDGVARYDLHELVRQYAAEKLEQAGEAEESKCQHAAYYLTLAEAAAPQLRGVDQLAWLNQLDVEHDNMRAALGWFAEVGDVELSLRCGVALARFWEIRGHLTEGRRWLEDPLGRSNAISATLRAAALLEGAGLAHDQGDHEQALAMGQESLTLYRALGANLGSAKALQFLGFAAQNHGDYPQAAVLLEESLARYLAIGDQVGSADVLTVLGYMACNQGDYRQAHQRFTESLAMCREQQNKLGLAWALAGLGEIAHAQGDYQQALRLGQESLDLFRECADKLGLAWLLPLLGSIALAQAKYAQAVIWLEESLTLFQHQDNRPGIASCLMGFVSIALAQQRLDRAARLLGAAEVRIAALSMLDTMPRTAHERLVAACRAQLDDAAFTVAWTEGQAMSLEQAIAYALEGSGADSVSSVATAAPP